MEQFQTGVINVPEQTKETAQKVGFLTKRGAKWKNWKRRYFVLKDNFLYYFAEPKDAVPKGVMFLEAASVANAEQISKKPNCFSVTPKKSFTMRDPWKDRVYFMQCANAKEMQAWMDAIKASNTGSKAPHSQPVSEEIGKLFKACAKGDTAAVKALIESNGKLDLSTMDDEGNTPLHWAAVGGHVELVKVLLQFGANVEIKSRDGFTPMHSVAQEDHKAVLQVLVEKGANVNAVNSDDNNNTTLHYAACWGAVECTKLLIANGALIDARASDQSTPLSFAAEKGHLSIAKLLIDAGANIESKNDPEEKGGATPLLLASHNGQIEVVKLLVSKGANVKEKTIDGLNCLHLAIRSGSDNEELTKVLAGSHCEVNGKTNNGDTPLHYASYMGYIKACTILIENKANLEEKGQNDSTPLHFASREGQLEVVKLLVSKGANLNVSDKDGDTPIQCAEINGHVKCVEILKK